MEPERTELNLEFVIDENQSVSVKTAEERIIYLFNVKVELKGVFAGSPKHKQWICVTGKEDETKKAKDYILALTSPSGVIRMKNIWGHPLFTPEKEDEIERTSCAALSKCEDDDLVIRGTEFSVMMAQSMIDDMFSKTCDDITDEERYVKDSRNTIPDSGAGIYCSDNNSSGKKSDRDELRVPASLNRNNSSLASVATQSTSALTMAVPYYTDDFLASDPRSSPHKITPSLYTPFSSSGSDAYHACYSNPHKKAFTENSGNCHSSGDSIELLLNTPSNGRIVMDQQPAKRLLYPHELIGNLLYASPSAIYPGNAGTQMFVSTVPQFCSRDGTAQANRNASHTVNHAGDGVVSKVSSNSLGRHQRGGQVGNTELPMEVFSQDSLSRMGPTCLSPQASEQRSYLRNLGHSLHYYNEDIEKGLAQYSMDDVVKPSEFLNTLSRIKAQRHGGGHQNIENPSVSHTTPVLAVPNSVARTATQTVSSEISVDDYSDLDASVICIGAVGEDDSAIVVSSEDEGDELEEDISDLPVSHNPPQPTHHYPAQPPSELQRTVRREPIVCMNREVTMNRDSVIMGENSAISQRPTGHRNLRYIIIDGSNVAMAHGNHRVFSVEGLKICINYFLDRGHDRITAFVPEWRRYSENQTSITGRELLEKMHNIGYIKFTPARRVQGKVIASYDDRFILNLAEKEDGIVVSNDQFRDLCQERASYHNIVEHRLLQYMFVGDHFMPPDDPLGRHGPHLDDFLRYPQQPQMPTFNSGRETSHVNMEERLIVTLRQPKQRQPVRNNFEQKMSQSVRSPTVTSELFEKLAQMFPEPNQAPQIHKVLNNHKSETDINRLTNYCMNALFT